MPLVQGFLADRIGPLNQGLHVSFFVPVLCYIYILYYGFIGSKIRATERAAA